MKNTPIKNTVFAFLSLSTAISTMGYAADSLSTPEDVAAHTPAAAQQLVVGAIQPVFPGITAPINIPPTTGDVRPREETARLLRRPATKFHREEQEFLNIFLAPEEALALREIIEDDEEVCMSSDTLRLE